MTWFHSFSWLSNIPLCIYIHPLYPFIKGHLCCLCVLVIVNSATLDIGVHVSFQMIVFSGYMPKSGIAESYGNSVFGFLRNRHAVLHTGCTSLHYHQQCRKIPFSLHPPHRLYAVDSVNDTVHGILHGRILEWGAISFSRGSSQPRDQTLVSHTVGRFLTSWAAREVRTLSSIYYFRIFADSHSDQCEKPHCSFDLHFSKCVSHLYVVFQKNIYLGLLPTFWLGCFFFGY